MGETPATRTRHLGLQVVHWVENPVAFATVANLQASRKERLASWWARTFAGKPAHIPAVNKCWALISDERQFAIQYEHEFILATMLVQLR